MSAHPIFARMFADMGALGLLPPTAPPIYTGPAPVNPTEPEPLVVPVSQTKEE